VRSVALIDRESAADPGIAGALSEGQLIYILGGFPGYLAEVLEQSPAWQAILNVQTRGGVLAGSSAGAMVLCRHYYDPGLQRLRKGLGLLPNACILPHHDTFGRQWAPALLEQLPGATLIGIDEQTGLIGRIEEDRWLVRGRGAVTLYSDGGSHAFRDGDAPSLGGHYERDTALRAAKWRSSRS
jgi:cyanophycinase